MDEHDPKQARHEHIEQAAQRRLETETRDGQPLDKAEEHTRETLEAAHPEGHGYSVASNRQRLVIIILSLLATDIILAVAMSIAVSLTVGIVTALVGLPFVALGVWPVYANVALRAKEKQEINTAIHEAEEHAEGTTPPTS